MKDYSIFNTHFCVGPYQDSLSRMIHTVHARHTNLRQIYAFSLIAIWPFARAFFSPPPFGARGTINSLVAFFLCASSTLVLSASETCFTREVGRREKKTFFLLFSSFHFDFRKGAGKKPGKSCASLDGRWRGGGGQRTYFNRKLKTFFDRNHGQNIYIHSRPFKDQKSTFAFFFSCGCVCLCVLFYPQSCSVIYGPSPLDKIRNKKNSLLFSKRFASP